MLRYPVHLEPDDDATVLLTCPALPIVLTCGETRGDALLQAVDAVETALSCMMDDGDAIPLLDGGDAPDSVTVPVQTELKVRLHEAMRRAGLTRADLALRLWDTPDVMDRLFHLDGDVGLERFSRAFAALGKSVAIEVREAA